MSVFIDAKDVQKGRFIDCRFNLTDSSKGFEAYLQGHIEGAVYMHLEDDLSDMTKQGQGRHPMPDEHKLQALFESVGLQQSDTIYVYDDGAEPFAARAYWMLHYAGFEHVSIVNGGFAALVSAGFLVSKEIPVYDTTSITPNWQHSTYASREYVHAITQGEHDAILVDARAAKRYAGEFEPLDPIAGHIPTALNFDWEQLKQGNELVVTEALKQAVDAQKEVVVYCGSGVTASPLYATLKQAGYEHVKLYVGSYSDWINAYDVEK